MSCHFEQGQEPIDYEYEEWAYLRESLIDMREDEEDYLSLVAAFREKYPLRYLKCHGRVKMLSQC